MWWLQTKLCPPRTKNHVMHVYYGGGTTTRWMVVTTIKGTTSLKNVCWLYYLSVVCFWLLSLWSHTSWLWQRDSDGGWWWRQRDERTTLPKKERWLYYLFLVFKNLFVVSHMLARAEGQWRGGWWWRRSKGRADNIAEERTLAILPVCCLFFCCCYLFGLPHAAWLWRRDNNEEDGTMGREDNITEESTLAMLPVCCLSLFFCLFVVSLMLTNGGRTAMRRIGGNDNGTHMQKISQN